MRDRQARGTRKYNYDTKTAMIGRLCSKERRLMVNSLYFLAYQYL